MATQAAQNLAVHAQPETTRGSTTTLAALAWRNIWRNRRRTWLTAGGIAFAVWMLVFSWSMNNGTFGVMIDSAARMFSGHVQVQHPDYEEEPILENVMSGVTELVAQVSSLPDVEHVAVRVQSAALVSAGERSYGALITGVAPEGESWSTLASSVAEGRYLAGPGEIILGVALARNLRVGLGEELVMLGTGFEGGVAAASATVVGLVSTGQPAMDRAVAQIHIDDFREAWRLADDQAHVVALVLDETEKSRAIANGIRAPGAISRTWQDLMPEMVQMVELKRSGQGLFFVLIAIIVTFSVVNTFMMTVFERTPELGMLRAVGMRGGLLQALLHLEALWLSLVGIGLGLLVTWVIIAAISGTGIPLPEETLELVAVYQMPDRLYPAYSWGATWVALVTMLIGTQLAVLLPAFRVRRMLPVEALRKED